MLGSLIPRWARRCHVFPRPSCLPLLARARQRLILHRRWHRTEQGEVCARLSTKDRQTKPLLLIRFSPQTSVSPSDLCTPAGQPGPRSFVLGILFKWRHQSHILVGHQGVTSPRGGLTHQGLLLSRHCPHPVIPTEQPSSEALVL